MEENNENSKKFKTVQDPNAYKKVLKKEKNNNHNFNNYVFKFSSYKFCTRNNHKLCF